MSPDGDRWSYESVSLLLSVSKLKSQSLILIYRLYGLWSYSYQYHQLVPCVDTESDSVRGDTTQKEETTVHTQKGFSVYQYAFIKTQELSIETLKSTSSESVGQGVVYRVS